MCVCLSVYVLQFTFLMLFEQKKHPNEWIETQNTHHIIAEVKLTRARTMANCSRKPIFRKNKPTELVICMAADVMQHMYVCV